MPSDFDNVTLRVILAEVLQRIEELLTAMQAGHAKTSADWLTVEDAALVLQVSRDTIERLIGSGQLKAARIDTRNGSGMRYRYRIQRSWLDEYLLRNVKRCEQRQERVYRSRQADGQVDFIGD